MIKEYYLKLKNKYNNLAIKEKRLIIIAIIIFSFLIIDRSIILPFKNYNKKTAKETEIYMKKILRLKKNLKSPKKEISLYPGKESQLIKTIREKITQAQLKALLLKPGSNTQDKIILKLELVGDIESILKLIAKTESMDFLIIWNKADIKYLSGNKYNLSGEINIYKI